MPRVTVSSGGSRVGSQTRDTTCRLLLSPQLSPVPPLFRSLSFSSGSLILLPSSATFTSTAVFRRRASNLLMRLRKLCRRRQLPQWFPPSTSVTYGFYGSQCHPCVSRLRSGVLLFLTNRRIVNTIKPALTNFIYLFICPERLVWRQNVDTPLESYFSKILEDLWM